MPRKLRKTDQTRIRPTLAALETSYRLRVRTLEAMRSAEIVNAPAHVREAMFAEHSHALNDFKHTLDETREHFGDAADRLVVGLAQGRSRTVQ